MFSSVIKRISWVSGIAGIAMVLIFMGITIWTGGNPQVFEGGLFGVILIMGLFVFLWLFLFTIIGATIFATRIAFAEERAALLARVAELEKKTVTLSDTTTKDQRDYIHTRIRELEEKVALLTKTPE